MTPEQETRARMLRQVLTSQERQSEYQGPTFEDAWRSVAALNSANDQLRCERNQARTLARQWQLAAYLVGVAGLLVSLLFGIVLVMR